MNRANTFLTMVKRRRFQSPRTDGDFGEMKKTETPAKRQLAGMRIVASTFERSV